MQVLRKIPFNESLLEKVRDFECGDQPWEIEVRDWIKAEMGKCGALDDLVRGKCEVWLYQNDENSIVGYSSLGATRWSFPEPHDPRKPISVIPNVAVASAFQRKGHLRTILSHLVAEALKNKDRLPVIGLFVDPRNETAITAYSKLGFDEYHHTYKDRLTGVTYKSMIAKLPE